LLNVSWAKKENRATNYEFPGVLRERRGPESSPSLLPELSVRGRGKEGHPKMGFTYLDSLEGGGGRRKKGDRITSYLRRTCVPLRIPRCTGEKKKHTFALIFLPRGKKRKRGNKQKRLNFCFTPLWVCGGENKEKGGARGHFLERERRKADDGDLCHHEKDCFREGGRGRSLLLRVREKEGKAQIYGAEKATTKKGTCFDSRRQAQPILGMVSRTMRY